jgi:hypothetical protein
MKKYTSRILYHGGSNPVPSYYQKGKIKLEGDQLDISAKGKEAKYDIRISIPVENIQSVSAYENKYYSSTAYMLRLEYQDLDGKKEDIDLEIRSFGKRGRARTISQFWAKTLSEKNEEC